MRCGAMAQRRERFSAVEWGGRRRRRSLGEGDRGGSVDSVSMGGRRERYRALSN